MDLLWDRGQSRTREATTFMPRFGTPAARSDLAEGCAALFQAAPVAEALAEHCGVGDPGAASHGAVLAVPLVLDALQESLRDLSSSPQTVDVLAAIDPHAHPDPVSVLASGGHRHLGDRLVDEALFDGPGRRRAVGAVAGGAGLAPSSGRCVLGAAAWVVAIETVRRTGHPVDRSSLAATLGLDVRSPGRPPAPHIDSATIVNEVVTTTDLESILGDRKLASRRLVRRVTVGLTALLVVAGVAAGVLWWLDRGDGDGGSASGSDVIQSARSGAEGSVELTGGSMILGLDLVDPLGFSTANAAGELSLDASAGTVCYSIVSEGVEAPHPASIHQGPAGFDGPAVVDLGSLDQAASGCVEVEASVAEAILTEPAGHYLEVADPEGAFSLRSQLTADG
jgi:hypothetical protein